MAKPIPALVKPDLLIWARTQVGFSIADLAKALKVKPELIDAWEAGEKRPSIVQVDKFAKKCGFPVAVLYLAERPKGFAPLRDFRRLPGEVAGHLSIKLTQQIRLFQDRRELALTLYDELNAPPPTFPSFPKTTDPEALGDTIRSALAVPHSRQMAWSDPYQAYNAWRDAIEQVGALVFQLSSISLAEARGIAVNAHPLPLIAVNAKDHPNGRIFTLMHELAHIAIGESAISDWAPETEAVPRPRDEQAIEVFCNKVAAAILMPSRDLLAHELVRATARGSAWSDEAISQLARSFSVSPEAALRRLLTLKRITPTFYQQRRSAFEEAYKRLARKPSKAVVPPHKRALGNLGPSLSRLLLETYHERRITLADLTGYLGITVPWVAKLESETQRRART